MSQNLCPINRTVSLGLLFILLFKEFFLFEFLNFWFKNAFTLLCLSRDKTKRQSSKNTTLTLTKTLPKKQGYSSVDFQITLSTYKLDSQNKNYIYKIKNTKFCFATK